MKALKYFLVFVVSFVIVLALVTYSIHSGSKSENTPPPGDPRVFDPAVVGWIPYWDQENAYESFRANVDVFDYVGLFWYLIESDGNIDLYDAAEEDKAIIEFAHDNDVEVLALIANLPDYSEGGDWDPERVQQVLQNKTSREKHIEAILDLINNNNFDGVVVDYESLRGGQRNNFSAFIKELSAKLQPQGKILGVAIHPKHSANPLSQPPGAGAQDLKEISKYTDQLYYMTYEEHNESSNPGPASSLTWMRKVYGYSVNSLGIPAEKVFAGFPLYAQRWSDESYDALNYAEVVDLQKNFDVNHKAADGEKKFEYRDNETLYQVWFNDRESIGSKLEVAKGFNTGGVFFWRLGQEDPDVWDLFR